MPTNTPNLNLVKPLVTENYDIAKVTNENADILDEAIHNLDLEKQDLPTVEKVTPINTDMVILLDSADSDTPKKWSWLNIKASLKTYFDALYQAILVSGTNIKTINGNSVLGSGDVELLPKNNPTATGTQTFPSIVTNGIKFPATQVPSADTNTLDDYKEGTWTPVVSSQDSGAITSYTINSATYVKIGKFISIAVRLTITNKGTGSGNLYISLPFNSTNAGSGSGRINNNGNALSIGVGTASIYALKYDGTNAIDNYEYNLSVTYTQA